MLLEVCCIKANINSAVWLAIIYGFPGFVYFEECQKIWTNILRILKCSSYSLIHFNKIFFYLVYIDDLDSIKRDPNTIDLIKLTCLSFIFLHSVYFFRNSEYKIRAGNFCFINFLCLCLQNTPSIFTAQVVRVFILK